jgi:hypothetical protein
MRIYVVPVNGARIPFIDVTGSRALLPAEGASVIDSTFWQRRIKDGEVAVGAPPATQSARKRGEE